MIEAGGTAEVVAVARSAAHTFSKAAHAEIDLVTGLGVEGDAHSGTTVKHRSRVAANPERPNLRQVHLIRAELFDELRQQGFMVAAGSLGENVTTRGLNLLQLPRGTLLHLGQTAVVEVTGLRNPCRQLDDFHRGLMRALLDRDADGAPVRKAGIMSVVRADGRVRPGDPVAVELPRRPHHKLEPV
jgi:MOSC domain-containing protein YiiM